MSSTSSQTIFRGDTPNPITRKIYFGGQLQNMSEPGWICKHLVKNSDGDIVWGPETINTVVKKDSKDCFQISMDYAQSESLSVPADSASATYMWITQIENSLVSPVYRREKHIRLIVKEQGIE